MKITILDLNFFKSESIASFLIETGDGPVLIETGPDTTYNNLTGLLKRSGYAPKDVRGVFVSHIHLDHAGAAWHFADEGATVYVHANGARHMADPSKLFASAKQIYKDDMDRLWGQLKPISQDRIHPTEDGEKITIGGVTIQAFATPGHASHHNVYLIDGMMFTGDVGGIRINDGPIFAPTPPPDINIEVWQQSLRKMRQIGPSALYLTHFGVFNDVREHLRLLEDMLLQWTAWIGERLKQGNPDAEIVKEFEAYFKDLIRHKNTDQGLFERYELADPAYMNAPGLIRYWRKFRGI
ncbi:MAG: MBL fold metallo-hydrolase [Deltaproteobacteria bacterium]|nr:MBL fold metallo-hydrolase [Deltaproteobacteria bacterium]